MNSRHVMPRFRNFANLLFVLLVLSAVVGRCADPSPAAPASDAEALPEPEFRVLLEPEWVLAPTLMEPPDLLFAPPDFETVPPPPPDKVKAMEAWEKARNNPKLWEGRVELGLNGSAGNSDRFATRYGAKVKRRTRSTTFTADLLYSTSTANGVSNEDKLLAESRTEWTLWDTPWHYFGHGTADYDRFTAFGLRLAADTGLGYQYVDTGWTQIKARAGVGFSKEFDSPDEEIVPEVVVGMSFEHRLTPRQKLIGSGDLFPDASDVQDFRIRSSASWEIKIDPPARLSLRLGVIERFDSTPNGKRKNDLDYSTLIVWEF
jgi:putative salt-induced outer membrane protein YdiY